MSEGRCTAIWERYEAGREHHRRANLYRGDERCHRFYEGDQWAGIRSGGEELPSLNFIRPICKYKVATVAMNDTAIIYTPQTEDPAAALLCRLLTAYAAVQWEQAGMDALKWEVVRNACVTGDHYLYCYAETGGALASGGPVLRLQSIPRTEIYLADEQQPDLQQQEWILIAERRPVAQLRRQAKANGIPARQIARILPDEADDTQVGATGADEVAREEKCTSLLFLQRREDGLHFCRATREVVYQPEQVIPGLDWYPVCGMRWEQKAGSARGVGVVGPLIPNQIEVNRTLARRAVCVKRYSFPTAVYDADRVANPEALGRVGASLKVKNLAGVPLTSMVQYLTPVGIGADAAALQSELVSLSRELEGASDAATGQVDPTRASGEAIKAARDQSALVLNEQIAAYRRMIEQLAGIWLRLWAAYAGNGLTLRLPDEEGAACRRIELPPGALDRLAVDVRIDISPIDPYSVLSRQMALENALAAGHITFEEYVGALDANGSAPRDRFREILAARRAKGGEADAVSPLQDGGGDPAAAGAAG